MTDIPEKKIKLNKDLKKERPLSTILKKSTFGLHGSTPGLRTTSGRQAKINIMEDRFRKTKVDMMKKNLMEDLNVDPSTHLSQRFATISEPVSFS